MKNFSPEQVVSRVNWIRLNAHGPYSMGVWKGENGIKVGDQESMAGRAEAMLAALRKSILEKFSLEQIKKLSIIDIGCNDGWLLHNLSDLPFLAMTGVEPREKNMIKGCVVREELRLTNSIEFIVGTIESVKHRKFDIVVNTGVLYHVANINQFISSLYEICSQFLFLESRTLNTDFINKKLIKQTELVDLPYKLGDTSIGMSTHKFETGYSDGSSFVETVVSLPTPEAIIMYLENAGFAKIKVELTPKKFRAKLLRKDRPLDGVCISAEVAAHESNSPQISKKQIALDQARHLEEIYESVLMPEKCLRLVEAQFESGFTFSIRNTLLKYWLNPKYFQVAVFERLLIKFFNLSPEQAMIFKDLKFNVRDKVRLERIKIAFAGGQLQYCQEMIDVLTATPNADWRSTYRAFHHGVKLASARVDKVEVVKYIDLLKSCNPNWPLFKDFEKSTMV